MSRLHIDNKMSQPAGCTPPRPENRPGDAGEPGTSLDMREKHKNSRWSASPEEFRATVESELGFLREKYGFKTGWKSDNPFEAVFSSQDLTLRVTGISYGFGAILTVVARGEELPLWPIITKMTKRFTPVTDKPQLDDIREYAYRLRHECLDIVEGNFLRLELARQAIEEQRRKLDEERRADVKGMFFSHADKLWKNNKYSELISHLENSPYEFGSAWQKRLDYAKKHV